MSESSLFKMYILYIKDYDEFKRALIFLKFLKPKYEKFKI